MRLLRVSPVVLAALAASLAAALAHARDPKPAPPAANPLDAALEARILGKASPDDVRIEASWYREPGHQSVRIWGDGLGVWQERTQFRLSKDEVLSILKLLYAARVGTMPAPDPKKPGDPAKDLVGKSPLKLLGELRVSVGSSERSLQQLTKGEQSDPLRDLVVAILALCEKAAKGGVGAASFRDGLDKLSAGTLAPQTFAATVRRQASGSDAGESWLLRMNGRRVTDRLMPRGDLPPPARELTISEAEFQGIVRLLRENDPAALPRNTWAPIYTDVTVEVLDQDRSVAARPYLGVTAETHGAQQKSFDRIYEAFRALHRRVQEDGRPAADAGVPRRAAETPTPASPEKR